MAKQIIDLSGQVGLLERHQGDLNDTSAIPNLRYLGEDGSFADGLFNPMKTYGYISPANNSFTSLTGTIAAPINSIQYDATEDTLYFAEEGENILFLSGLDDLTLANYIAVDTGTTIKDMVLYEVNAQKSLMYLIDSNTALTTTKNSIAGNGGGMYIGFKTIDTTEGMSLIDKDIKASDSNYFEINLCDVASQDFASYRFPKMAQEFDGGDVYGRKITGVSVALRRSSGTGVGITLKISIQSPATTSTAGFTARGAWATATSYAINDTVTDAGQTYQCYVAHVSAAGNSPSSGSANEDFWNFFGAPDGTALASTEFLLSDIPELSSSANKRINFEFDTPVTGLNSGNYWLVIEEVGTNMTAGDRLSWIATINQEGIYDGYQAKGFLDQATDIWKNLDTNDPNTGKGLDTFDFRLICNRDDNLTAYTGTTTNTATIGAFGVESGEPGFLYLADNGILYWFQRNKVHTFDGSITGGPVGKASETVLQFPSYIVAADVAEARSRMYIGIQSSNNTSATDGKTFGANKIGVYVWDRRTQIQGQSDFYPCPGAREIKSLFTSSSGDVLAITISNSGFTEIRGINGNQYAVLHTFEKNGYPASRRGVSQVDNMSTWLGANGIFYAYGSVTNSQKKQLYKIGNITETVDGTFASGPVFVGHNEATEPRTALLFGVGSVEGETVNDFHPVSLMNSFIAIVSSSSGSGSGQTFVATAGNVTRVEFFFRNDTVNGFVQAHIWATAAGVPTGAPLVSSDIIDLDDISALGELTSFTFSSPYTLTPGVTYAVGYLTSSLTGAGSFEVGRESSPTSSHPGTRYSYSSSSGLWTSVAFADTIFYLYENVANTGRLYKWYPNGDGTIDSIAQKPQEGNIFTKVYTLPSLATVKYARLMMAPGVATGTTTIANLKCYYNQSATAAWTKAITLDDIHKGWKNIEINRNNVNFIQFEIEYVDTITLGDSDFKPMYIELEYDDERRINP